MILIWKKNPMNEMAQTNMVRWRVFCTGAGNHGKQHIWRPEQYGPPTHCPMRDTDPIDPNDIRIVQRKDANTVKIENENGNTGGNFHSTSRKLAITESTDEQCFEFAIPVDISIFHLRFYSEEIHRGDEIELLMAPNTYIGKIMQNVTGGADGDVLIHVQETVTATLNLGYYVTLNDGNYKEELGRVIEIDGENHTITVEHPPSRTYSSTGTGTNVLMTIKTASTYHIGPPMLHGIGETNYDSSFVPKDTPMVVKYINKNAQQKELIVYIDYKY